MRAAIASCLICSLLWAQPAKQPAAPAKAAPTKTAAPPSSPPAKSAQQDGQAKLDGFDGIAWGSTYKDVKERFRTLSATANPQDNVEIVADTPDREILIRRREIYYRYVFYKKPADKITESMPRLAKKPAEEKPAAEDPSAGTARFFFVESIFPLLKAEELYTKLSEKYGQRTGSNVGENQRGAHTWEKEDGFLVQWVEPYGGVGYTRTLFYLSRKIRDEIKADLQAWQYVREIQALENLLK